MDEGMAGIIDRKAAAAAVIDEVRRGAAAPAAATGAFRPARPQGRCAWFVRFTAPISRG